MCYTIDVCGNTLHLDLCMQHITFHDILENIQVDVLIHLFNWREE